MREGGAVDEVIRVGAQSLRGTNAKGGAEGWVVDDNETKKGKRPRAPCGDKESDPHPPRPPLHFPCSNLFIWFRNA